MSSLINFNTSPYFEDYDETKNYHRILFRPSTAVQAREATQLQTILQNQIQRFGNYIFRNGDIVQGCSISDIPNLPFVRMTDYASNSLPYNISLFSNTLVVSATSNLQARVLTLTLGAQVNYPNTSVIYVNYLNIGNNGATVFANNEQLNFYKLPLTGNSSVDLIGSVNTYSNSTVGTTTTGMAHGITISDGIVFIEGFFVKIQTPIFGLVNTFNSYAGNNLIGFILDESIVTENQDPTLFDNALGYENENAPGAHRLKLDISIQSLDQTTAAATPGFNPVASYNFGSLITKELPSSNLYSSIGDAIAERIYEEAGNYVVNPFTVDTVSSINAVPVSTVNASLTYARVTPGVGYAQGYRVELLKPAYVSVRRGSNTTTSLSQQITFNYGGYYIVNEVAGMFPFETIQQVQLYNAPQKAVTSKTFDTLTPTGTNIGTALLKCFSYLSGQQGANNAQYYIHLFNINLTSNNTSSSIASIYYNGATPGSADIVSLPSSVSGNPDQLFSFGINALKNLRDTSNNNNCEYTYRRHATGVMSTSGVVTITISTSSPGGSDILTYGPGVLNDAESGTYTLVLLANGATNNLSGTVNVYSTNTAITGSSTTFTSDFVVGDLITVSGTTKTVTAITNSISLNVDSAFGSPLTGQNYVKTYINGQIIPFSVTMPGSRNITINSSTSFTINTGQTPSSTLSCAVYFDVLRTNVSPASKVINKNRFVKIDTTVNPIGPWCLGFSDISKVTGIYGSISNTYAITGANLMSSYVYDTGQKDSFYDLGYLYLAPGAVTSTYPYLTIQLDYFTANTSSGLGFFTVESYPIDDANTANTNAITTAEIPLYIDSGGNQNPLRNYVDFRPQAINVSVDTGSCDITNSTQVASSLALATYIPTYSLSFSYPVNGLNIPSYGKNFQGDYTYYLPRKDLLYFTTSNDIKVKEGASSLEPQTPLYPMNGMPLAVINIPPYPSLTADQIDSLIPVNVLSKNLVRDVSSSILCSTVTNRRYTMSDIGKLDQRISDLEYYVSLTLLETSAASLTITDQNGLDRFKNGIFVDSFCDFSQSDVSNPEYTIAIDQGNCLARPRIRTITVDTTVANTSNNVQVTNNIITLPYSNTPHITQPCSTTVRQCSQKAACVKTGRVCSSPTYDCHNDIIHAHTCALTDDASTPCSKFSNTPFGSLYGVWRTGCDITSTPIITAQSNNSTISTTVTDFTNSNKCSDPPELTNQLCMIMTNNDKTQPVQYFTIGNQCTSWNVTPTQSRGTIPTGGAQYSTNAYYIKTSRQ